MDKKILSTAGFFGMTAIILGAFGAHLLKQHLTVEHLNSFETGVKYQMYHALFLLFLGINGQLSLKTKKTIFIPHSCRNYFFLGFNIPTLNHRNLKCKF
jgi:uncharacterized membrane protein YgdD (TMEM256/DUF423 family)